MLAHLFLQRGEFGLQDLHASDDDFIRRKSACGFDCEKEFLIVFAEFGGLFKPVVLGVLFAFLAETAVFSIFNVDDFS